MKITTEIVTLFGMALVSSIEFHPAVKICRKFSEAFLNRKKFAMCLTGT